MASSKLAALQAQIESNAEEIEHEISESQRLVGGGGPAYDPEEGALDQRRSKARRKRAAALEEVRAVLVREGQWEATWGKGEE